jgi:regulatory protein
MWPSRKKAGRPADASGPDASPSGFSRSSESNASRARSSRWSGKAGSRAEPTPRSEAEAEAGAGADTSRVASSSAVGEHALSAAAANAGSTALSAFATGESFDPPESATADTLQRKSARTPVKRSLKGRALGYLSRREHSRAELERKLTPFVEEGESLDAVLDALQTEGWLSDARFAESVVHRRAARFGASRIIGELKRNAVDGELIDQLAGNLRDSERSRAHAVWSKRFKALPATHAERARQARFLMMRGFSSAAVSAVLKGGAASDEDFDAE